MDALTCADCGAECWFGGGTEPCEGEVTLVDRFDDDIDWVHACTRHAAEWDDLVYGRDND